MSTRSQIAILNGNDSITSVYCHSDGYPEWNGKILVENYQTPEKVIELLSYGDISSLDLAIGTKHDFMNRTEGETTFYGRDRDEQGIDAKTMPTAEFEKWARDCDAEWAYLFKEKEWYVSKVEFRGGKLKFNRVVDVLKEPKYA